MELNELIDFLERVEQGSMFKEQLSLCARSRLRVPVASTAIEISVITRPYP
jgi:hypothetical protein